MQVINLHPGNSFSSHQNASPSKIDTPADGDNRVFFFGWGQQIQYTECGYSEDAGRVGKL